MPRSSRTGARPTPTGPPAVLVRLALVLGFGGLITGLVLFVTGCASRDVRVACSGLACLFLAVAGVAGLRSWAPAVTEAALNFDPVQPDAEPAGGRRVEPLVDLLQQWEALEQERGAPNFDPWVVHAVRRDIRQIVDKDPALDRLFRP